MLIVNRKCTPHKHCWTIIEIWLEFGVRIIYYAVRVSLPFQQFNVLLLSLYQCSVNFIGTEKKTYITVTSCTEDILFTYRIAFVLAQEETQFDSCGLGGAVVVQATLGRGSLSDLSPASGCQPKPELSLSPDLWKESETLGTYIAWCRFIVTHPEPTTRAGDTRPDWWDLQIGNHSFHLGWLLD